MDTDGRETDMAITRDRMRPAPNHARDHVRPDVEPRRRRRVRVLPIRPAPARRDVAGAVPGSWAHGLMAAWVVLFSVGVAIEPAPADPTATPPLYATLLITGFFGLLAATFGGLAVRKRWGVLASVGASILLLGMSVSCPATGHHALAAWWFGQLACSVTLVGLSLGAWRRA